MVVVRRNEQKDDRCASRVASRFGGNEAGQDLAEYAILVGLIAVVVVGALSVFGAQLVALFQRITGALPFG